MIVLQGALTVVKERQLVGNFHKFAKRECVLRLNEGKHEEVLIEFHQDDCSMLDGYSVGDDVSIDITVRGRSWINPGQEVKYFNSLQGCRITRIND